MAARTQKTGDTLAERRNVLQNQWSRFVSGTPSPEGTVRHDIFGSWKRSAKRVAPALSRAPRVIDDAELAEIWGESTLKQAAEAEIPTLQHMAEDGAFVMGLADPAGRLLWTCASDHMGARAEEVNFVTGGQWDEASAGTNAVGLSLQLKRPTTVFSSEHYLAFVHDWVCYAAPILHPATGTLMGVLDISTTWNRHTPLGQAGVSDIARSIAAHLPDERPKAELEIHALGTPRIVLHGKEIRLPLRQVEVLCLLALYPDGLTLDGAHARLYGDAQISVNTLKAEICYLRRALGGRLGSRPYRLQLSVWADFIELWHRLQSKEIDKAVGLYRGPLLTRSDSPELEEWRYCIDAVMGEALSAQADFNDLLQSCTPHKNGALIRDRLVELAREGCRP